MQGRIDDIPAKAGKGYKAMASLEAYLAGSGIPQGLQHLVKLRVSQINGCAFCVDMHSKHAQQGGETDERLFQVAACASRRTSATPSARPWTWPNPAPASPTTRTASRTRSTRRRGSSTTRRR
ncbi:carboxymuconolactone decarboxylase family protein [Saccharopolyspora tripterygii]